MKKKLFTALGLMSGTSMDGLDLSLIKSDGKSEFMCILNDYFAYDRQLKSSLFDLRSKLLTLKDLEKYVNEINNIEREYTLFVVKTLDKVFKNYNNQIDFIGFHGQTIYHNSDEKISKQIGNGKILSQMMKKVVINNFRNGDLDNGGQGAPLTPIFHKLISQTMIKTEKIKLPINIINIGGITNITHICNSKNSSDIKIFAYDIGPGNCLIDNWVRKNSKKNFDENGNIANSGKIDELILNQAIENFEIFSFNKSLDIKDFDISFAKGLSLENGCATLTEFSAYLISKGIEFVSRNHDFPEKINLICGGGRKNFFLIDSIKRNLQKKVIKNIDEYGFDGDYIESQAFGYLAIRSFLKLPISYPETTRCKKPSLGGEISKNF